MVRRLRISVSKLENHRNNLSKNPRGPTPKVCDVCQLRKVKCDRELPTCSGCKKLGYPCTYNRMYIRDKGKGRLHLNTQNRYIMPKLNDEVDLNEASAFKIYDTNLYNEQMNQHLVLTKTPTPVINICDLSNNMEPIKSVLVNLMYCKPLDPTLKRLQTMIKASFLNQRKAQLAFDEEGRFIYTGSSMATSYITRNIALLNGGNLLKRPKKIKEIDLIPTIESNAYIASTEMLLKSQKEVIDLYFLHLHTFFPILHPPSFFSQLNDPKYFDNGFRALLYSICLAGSSFHPDRGKARILGSFFGEQAVKSIKLCYLKPSLSLVQACTILALHINASDSGSLFTNGWYFSGIAHKMATQLGYFQQSNKRSNVMNHLVQRVTWLMSINEVLISHITGRQKWPGAEVYLRFPTLNTSNVMVNIDHGGLIKIPELLDMSGDDSLKFFKSICQLIYLIGKLDDLNKEYQLKEKVSSTDLPTSEFFKTTLGRTTETEPLKVKYKQRSYLKRLSFINSLRDLEEKVLKWYGYIPKFISPIPQPENISIPLNNDLYSGGLHIYFFSYLIDLNKGNIKTKHQLTINIPEQRILLLESQGISFIQFGKLNPLEKCYVCARLAHIITVNSQGKLPQVLTPWFWHAMLQMVLIFATTISRIVDRKLKDDIIGYLKEAKKIFIEGASKWALVKDCLYVVTPYIDKYIE